MANSKEKTNIFRQILSLFGLILKLFGLIPFQFDFKQQIARQHLPSLVYSIVVILVVLIAYPIARIYIYLELMKLQAPQQTAFAFLLGVINGIVLMKAVVVILIQTTSLRKSLEGYFCQRFKIMDRLRASGFQSTADKQMIWLFVAMIWKIFFGLIAKLCTQFFVMRNLFPAEDLNWLIHIAILITLIPLLVINLTRNFFFEGVMFLNMLLDFARKDTARRLTKVVGRNNICTQSHQVWDIVDHLSILYGQIFELKVKLIRWSSFSVLMMIVQEIINLTIQIYWQYISYIFFGGALRTILATSYYLTFQLVVGFIDLIITLSACQLLLQKRECLVAMTMEMYKLDLDKASRNYLDLFNIQLAHQPMSLIVCGMFSIDLPILTAMIIAVSNYLFILMQFEVK